MSFSPQRPKAGNAFVAGSGQQAGDAQQGAVKTARERLRAVQAVREQAYMSERIPISKKEVRSPSSPKSPKRPWEAPPYSPTSRSRTYEQDHRYQEQASESSWPLPASRYNPGKSATSTRPKNSSSTQMTLPAYPQTFYDADQNLSPQNLQPPEPTFRRSRDGYTPSGSYGADPPPSVPRRSAPTASSVVGGIPDFPLPTSQFQPGSRQSQNLVPTGKSRHPPSSYYSQLSGPFGVSPIPEESNSRTINSYALSNAIPSAQMKNFYLEETPSDEDDGEFDWEKDGEKVKESQLVRQASLGRRQKPALTTIRGGESLRPPVATPSMPKQVPGADVTRISRVASILDGESLLSDASSLERSRERERRSTIGIDLSEPFTPGDNSRQGGLGRLGSLRNAERGSTAGQRHSKMGTLADRVGSRRPPSLDVQAVRDAEARASLTSLPDLIKRATRLAANLDKGRTASRLGVEWMMGDDGKPIRGFVRHPSDGSSLSGMLRSFPPPATMARGQNLGDSGTPEEAYKNLNAKRSRGTPGNPKSGRRICGFSVKAFISIVIIVIFLIAAAVILPVFLIVLPKKYHSTTSSSVPVASALENCEKINPCSNGGSVVINLDQSCGCICTNGFTGAQCTTQSNAGCTNIAATGTKSASVGTQVPDLIQAAQQNFSIPLDATALSSAFAVNNMTCTTENAIVTFPSSSSQKRDQMRELQDTIEHSGSNKIERRTDDLDYTSASSATLVTASTTIAAASTTSATSMPMQTDASGLGTNSTSKQFAKVGILFVLQDSRDLAVAVSAQENLSQFFLTAAKGGMTIQEANNITLGSGYFMDLWYLTVTLRNGTQYGAGVNFNGTVTGFSNVKRATSARLLKRVLY